MTQDSQKIFVSVASYRDTECPRTLADLFAKASHPQRVQVGLLLQLAPEDDESMSAMPAAWQHQIRFLRVDAATSLGVCWARHRIQAELWQGEDVFFQIDSHSRFQPAWDEKLVAMLASCPSPKPVLSTHPNPYKPPDELPAPGMPVLVANNFNSDKILSPKGKTLPLASRPAIPLPSAFMGGGFFCAYGQVVQDVPYDPYLYFGGEEISMAVRLWTHGYDLFSPNDVIVYHDYTTDRGRRRHWSDHVDWGKLNRRAAGRIRHLLGIEMARDPEVILEMNRYGLGSARTLEEYETFADVSFKEARIGLRAADGRFPPPRDPSPTARALEKRFTEIYLTNMWKSAETRSGPGSTLVATRAMRQQFQETLDRLKIRTLVDAGCGDLNWQADITRELDLYLGFDAVEAMMHNNRMLFGHRKNHFFNTADISRDMLPMADALLCRHTLTHLPNPAAKAALDLFMRSGCRYLLATTYPDAPNQDIEVGYWRPMDLTKPPFSLPAPWFTLPDGTEKSGCLLAVWKMVDLCCLARVVG